jgi:hypothetical protein
MKAGPAIVALLLLGSCAEERFDGTGPAYDFDSGLSSTAQPTRLSDGSEGFLVECTGSQTECARRANAMCGGVAQIRPLGQPRGNQVWAASNASQSGIVPPPAPAVYSVLAKC